VRRQLCFVLKGTFALALALVACGEQQTAATAALCLAWSRFFLRWERLTYAENA
jgi:hypothetical protein